MRPRRASSGGRPGIRSALGRGATPGFTTGSWRHVRARRAPGNDIRGAAAGSRSIDSVRGFGQTISESIGGDIAVPQSHRPECRGFP